jgi:disulfide bond formation protein DsbB
MIHQFLAGRAGYFLGAFGSFGLVPLAILIQVTNNLEPCPLCISQRIVYLTLALLLLIAGIHNPGLLGRRIYGGLHFIAAATGMGIAARHVWIQSHADQVMSECGAGFGYIFERFPLRRALELVFKGTGDCAVIDWTFHGITFPQLSFTAFTLLAAYVLAMAFAKRQ